MPLKDVAECWGGRLTGFGWTRLAYLLVVLSVLGALVQLGSPAAEPKTLASEPAESVTGQEDTSQAIAEPSDTGVGVPAVSHAPREESGRPAFARHLRREISGAATTPSGGGAATFYRPTPPDPPAATPTTSDAPATTEAAPTSGPVCGNLVRYPAGNRLVFPLPMRNTNSYGDTWGAPRPQGGHEGTDLMVPSGTPEYAVTDGTIVPVAGSNGNGWNSLGGYAVMLRAAYSVGPVREGDLFYYAHLRRGSVLPLGATVQAGQVLGYAGDTGQGPEGTRGLFPPHLHLGWYDATGTRSYLSSGAMNPYPLLEWLKSGGGVLGGGSKAHYCEVARPGAPIPSTGDPSWPEAKEAGARPDLDTDSQKPAPSPAVEGRARGRQAGHPERVGGSSKPTTPAHHSRTAGKNSPQDPAKAAPDPKPRPPAQPSADPETPGKPPPRDEQPPDSPPEDDVQRPLREQDPKAEPEPPAPENDPPKERSDRPDKKPREQLGNPGESPSAEPGQQEPGGNEPGEEKPEDDRPKEDKPGSEEPRGEEPDGSSAPPEEEPEEEETTPEPETDEDSESVEPEATTPEATASASAEATTAE